MDPLEISIQVRQKKFLGKLLFLFLIGFYTITTSAQSTAESYPKINGYIGILHPIVTFSSQETTTNFKDYYLVAVPMGINIWKTNKIGFSFEVTPSIKSDNQISKVSNLLIHPGILVKLNKDFTFTGRIAFETSGRYGFTPVITKIIKRNKSTNFYVSLPMPVRFGNDMANTISLGLQFGIGF